MAVVQFLDFTANIVSGTCQIYQNSPDFSQRHVDVETITKFLVAFNGNLQKLTPDSGGRQRSAQDHQIEALANRCQELGEQLLYALELLKPRRNRGSREDTREIQTPDLYAPTSFYKTIAMRESLSPIKTHFDGYSSLQSSVEIGKAGSGKSTLIRFLHDHERTRDALQSWAGNGSLAIASFFFWNSGAEIQMSFEGLLRTLLHQLLQQMPDLIPVVFPYRVEARMLYDERAFKHDGWPWEELIKAFRVLVDRATEISKLAIFIDGLDEFEGNPSELVEFIAALANTNVKICAASRPWIVFEDKFRQGPHLKLEDLTYNDIKSYVTLMLTATPAFQAFQEIDSKFSSQLIENVCSKSSGVFLWVTLVSQSLLDGISEGERLCDLQRRLDSLPEDLEALFWKILYSFSRYHFERASQLFQLVRASLGPPELLELSFADEDDPEYAFSLLCKPLSHQELQARAELMRRRINACCKGLLDARLESAGPYAEVTFLHRTVKDFLERPETWSKPCEATNNFNPNLCLSSSQIAALKTQEPSNPNEEYVTAKVSLAIAYALRANRDSIKYEIRAIDEIDRTITLLSNTHPSDGILFIDHIMEWKKEGSLAQFNTSDPGHFRLFALRFELVGSIQAFLKAKSKQFASSHASDLLCSVVSKETYIKPYGVAIDDLRPGSKIVKLLFEYGANPHEKYGNMTTWELFQKRIKDEPDYFEPSFIEEFRKLTHDFDTRQPSKPSRNAKTKIKGVFKLKTWNAKWSRHK
ncbi:hypothetical protein K458DRAFT_487197 [Lentithecium fluviatile CBS 122367]|uniref:Uncharacterized protein n=1 Tax=Lentithecium fluviatile CBS 122367 TaxID=1168545 RepID=A0A6G1J374_9PLEO|nr:hypothetical protein K458DRAFT_487197 [Lentithecium fluviatile CBS 122367]